MCDVLSRWCLCGVVYIAINTDSYTNSVLYIFFTFNYSDCIVVLGGDGVGTLLV